MKAALAAVLLLIPIAANTVKAAGKSGPQKAGSIYHKGWIDLNKNGVKDIYEDPAQPIEKRVEDLLSQMTVEEKTCQLVTAYGYGRVLDWALPAPEWKERVWKDGVANIDEHLNGVGRGYSDHYDLIYPFSNHVKALHEVQKFFVEETRLGIPAEFTNEGIHGLNHTKATPLPAPIAIGSTWDRDLVRRAGEIAGEEARLIGYHSVYAPILDVARDQRWGRTVESYGEDPYLIAELGTQMVEGIQSQGVTSCLKHFAAYSVPAGGRDGDCRTDPQVNPRDLHQILMYPFAQVIANTHPMEVMSSYNDWNGEPVSASRWFLTQLLRETYGFDGYVVSDSQAVEFMFSKHQIVPDMGWAAKAVLEAGLNVRTNFWQPETYVEPLREAVSDGRIAMETIDQRVREVLGVKFRLGLFDNPYTGDGVEADAKAGAARHEDFILEMARKSLILLKNEGELLPLDMSKLGKILVTGPLADASGYMTSRYGPNGLDCTTILQGIRDFVGTEAEIVFQKGCEVTDPRWPESEIIPCPLSEQERSMMDEAVAAAADADVIIAVVGEDEQCVGESLSRTSLDLPGRQRQLLQELQATGKPVVMVLIAGQPQTINWENAALPAILNAWFPNKLGGQAVAEALFGAYNPGGHLTVTFPKSIGQIPYCFPYKKGSHGGQPGSRDPNGGGKTRVIGSLYPFGYGLSYTTFSYSDLQVREKGFFKGKATSGPASGTEVSGPCFEVSCTVTNTGKRTGDEVVQLYLHDRISSLVAYESVLRGFERITLKPGESGTVRFTLGPEQMVMLDKDMHWVVEPGDFEIRIGSSSEDIRLREDITVRAQ
ncbi:MAG: glycoside hydrolase family 3 C-terminal domain-containing protein [Bacteroidales bacterium]|nr:glycoside hydrolase family 3 C-terminal domain-containing protein [Bacteroidales bacterium]